MTHQPQNAVTTRAMTGPGRAGVGASLLQLQQRYGNQYVARLAQRLGQAGPAAAMHSAVHDMAASGVQGAGHRLPHADRIQQALGPHRLDGVQAHTDAAARAASRELGTEAYTTGNKIAFASRDPDLRTVAHEAVHVIQQRAGLPGDRNDLERRAETAADAIEHGRSPAGFLPGPGSQQGSAAGAPAVQAKVSVSTPKPYIASFFLGSAPTVRELQTVDELKQFIRQHRIPVGEIAKRRYYIQYISAPLLLQTVARRMVSDEQDRTYDDTEAGARELADALCHEAYGHDSASSIPAPTGSPDFLEFPSFGSARRSKWGYEEFSRFGESVRLPAAVGNWVSGQVRNKVQEHTPENPVKEGLRDTVAGRLDAMTRLPENPRKAVEVLPWADYYFNAEGDKDLQRTVDIAASKMSLDEAARFKADIEKLKIDQLMKTAVSAGASLAVGQAVGLIPHPAAKAARVVWTATGATAMNNKLADVSDKLGELKEKHPKAFRVMEERRDQQLKPVHAERRERLDKLMESVGDSLHSPFS
jgi:Domain of unknown function (DUF4157)